MHLIGITTFLTLLVHVVIFASNEFFRVVRQMQEPNELPFNKAFIFLPDSQADNRAILAQVPHEKIEFEENCLYLLAWDLSKVRQFPFIGSLVFALMVDEFGEKTLMDNNQDELMEQFANALYDYLNALPSHLQIPHLNWWHGNGQVNFYNKLYNSALLLLYVDESISFLDSQAWKNVQLKCKKKILKKFGESSLFNPKKAKNPFVLEEIIPRIKKLTLSNEKAIVKGKGDGNLGMFNFFVTGETLNFLLSRPLLREDQITSLEEFENSCDFFAKVTQWISKEEIGFHSPNYSLLFALMEYHLRIALHLSKNLTEEPNFHQIVVEKLANLVSLIKSSHFWQLQLSDIVYFNLKSKFSMFAKQLSASGQLNLLEKLANIIFKCFARRLFQQIAIAFDILEEERIDHFKRICDFFSSLNSLLYGDVMFKYAFTQSQFKRISSSNNLESLIESLKEACPKPTPFSDVASFKKLFQPATVDSPWKTSRDRAFSNILAPLAPKELQEIGNWRGKKFLALFEFPWATGLIDDFLQQNEKVAKLKLFVSFMHLPTFSRKNLALALLLHECPANLAEQDNEMIELLAFTCPQCETKLNKPSIQFKIPPSNSICCYKCLVAKKKDFEYSFRYSPLHKGIVFERISSDRQ